MAENNRTAIASEHEEEEFNSVVIPIFDNSDPSSCLPSEAEKLAEDWCHTTVSENAVCEPPISPTKRCRVDLMEDIVVEEEPTVGVAGSDWLGFDKSSSVADVFNEEDDAMWDDRLATLVEQIETGLRDEEGASAIFDDDDTTEIIENISFSAEHMGSDTLTMPVVTDEESNESETAALDNDMKPLYPTASVTLGAVMVLLALFTIKHDLPAEAIGNLLSLISLALPASHNLPTTVSKFKRYFKNLRNPLCIHYYCSFCLTYIDSKTLKVCPNGSCLCDLTNKKSLAYFVEIPILQQLKTFFSRPTFYDDIQHRFRRKKKAKDNIEDVYDGNLYKELCAKGILNSGDNISFLMNTDGVPVFKSSKVSIWPLYFVINELDYHKRIARENMLFAGLWFGEKKPAMWTFLKPHIKALDELELGLEMESPIRGKFICKAVLLACTCDLPARCLVCNSMQYNGEHGCWKCLQPGRTVKTGLHGHSRAFPFNHADPKGPQRTRESTMQYAKKRCKNK